MPEQTAAISASQQEQATLLAAVESYRQVLEAIKLEKTAQFVASTLANKPKVSLSAMPESIQRDIVQAALKEAADSRSEMKEYAVAMAEAGVAAYAVVVEAIKSS